MAAITHAVASASTTQAESYTTGSFSPSAGDLLVVLVTTTDSVEPVGLTDTQTLGWTLVATATKSLTADSLYLYVADATASASSMTVTFDCTGDEATGCVIQVMRVSGMSRTGSDAIRQFGVSSGNSAGTPSVTLGAAALTTNPTVGAVMHGDGTGSSDPTPPTGFTDLDLSGYTSPTLGTLYTKDESGFTGTSVAWTSATSTNYGALAFELDASSAGVSGSASVTLGGATLSGDGDVPVAGSASKTLADATSSAAGAVALTGSASVTLDDLTGDGEGAASLNAGWLTLWGPLGLFGATPAMDGELAATLEAATSAATGTVAVQGSAAPTLQDATAAATGTVAMSGAASVTLDDVTLASDGDVPRTGSTTATLADATLVATATGAMTGSLSSTLEDATSTATGTVAVQGSASVTLGDVTLVAYQTAGIEGALAATLVDVWSYGVGTVSVQGASTPTLGDVALTGAGTVANVGSSTPTLEDATLVGTGLLDGATSTDAAWRWGEGDIEDYDSAYLAPSLVLDDGVGDDTVTGEEAEDINDFSGDPACAWRDLLALGTAIGDLGSQATLVGYRFTAGVTIDLGDNIECVIPPEEEETPASYVARVYTATAPDGPYTLTASHTLTETLTTFSGAFSGTPVARYVKVLLTASLQTYDSSDTTRAAVELTDVEITYWPATAAAPPTDAPIVRSPGLVECEGPQVTLTVTQAVTGADYYEVWRVSDTEPLPGVLIYSGDRPTEGEPVVDTPRALGVEVAYRARACNDDGCGPWSDLLYAAPCAVDGTLGACACTWSPRAACGATWTALEHCQE